MEASCNALLSESHNFFSEMCMESHNFDDMLVLPAKSRHGRVFLPESIYRRMLRISRMYLAAATM